MYFNGKRIQVLKIQRQLFYFLRVLGKKAHSTTKDIATSTFTILGGATHLSLFCCDIDVLQFSLCTKTNVNHNSSNWLGFGVGLLP
jgi:hypothetical protein